MSKIIIGKVDLTTEEKRREFVEENGEGKYEGETVQGEYIKIEVDKEGNMWNRK